MVLSLHALLYVIAVVCFLIAACPTGTRYRFECFAFAALTLTLLI